LRGEGFFKIKKNKTKPFIVKTNGLTTEVLGTEFNVNTTLNKTIVTVEEGLVKVYSEKNDPLYVSPNNQVVFDKKGETMYMQKVNPILSTYWGKEEIILKNISLDDFLEVITTVYSTEISGYEKRKTANTTSITIAFNRNEPVESVINRYNFIAEINHLQIKDKQVYINKK
jgi:ferric-dicitrate binding protein FerR (iron transport regulator)